MASTNQTSNLKLSQFIGSDSPKWLTDYNSDMEKIDTGYGSVKAQADATDLTVSGHTASITSLTDSVGDQTTAIQNIRTAVTANTGSINTINSLIGNGEPTTSDKTIIGAINEIYADITGSGADVEAENISYDNTASGLTATDVQAAIDELAGSTGSATSSLLATVTPVSNWTDPSSNHTLSDDIDNYKWILAIEYNQADNHAICNSMLPVDIFKTGVSLFQIYSPSGTVAAGLEVGYIDKTTVKCRGFGYTALRIYGIK